MKSLIISIVILAVIITVIFSYGMFSSQVTQDLSSFVNSEKALDPTVIEQAYKYWLDREVIVHIGVNSSFTENISLAFLSLRSAVSAGDSEDIISALELLKHSINELKKVNRISWENIL